MSANTIRAARIHRYGPPEVFQIDQIPRPDPGPKDVLIRIAAAAVNPVDTKIRSGNMRAAIRYRLPRVLGMDLSGTIVALGEEVTGFAIGDQVWSSTTHKREGCYAEYVAVDAAAVAPKPATISHVEAASLAMVALTAWACLVESAQLQAGEKVLITAGSGGVGTAAIQIAKHLGATVATTCSTRNIDLVTSLGADVVIDYTAQAIAEVIADYDVGLDTLGGASAKEVRAALRGGGRIASITADLPAQVKRFGPTLGLLVTGCKMGAFKVGTALRGKTVENVLRGEDGATLREIGKLVDSGALKPVIDRIFPLEAIAEAHRYSETGRARGKIVIAIDEAAASHTSV